MKMNDALYEEGSRFTCGFIVDINSDKCGKCHPGIDKSGMVYMCPNHSKECDHLIMTTACKWGKNELD